MIILLHSSKTMRGASAGEITPRRPLLLDQARRLDACLKTLSAQQLARIMRISDPLAEQTHALIAAWTDEPSEQSLALDSFVGDIYSGLHANDLSRDERDYADQVLRILSGLYGILRPYDGICPYRLEMGYKLPHPEYGNLYSFWGDQIAATLPLAGPVINLAAVEYSQTVTAYLDADRIVTPRFLTVSPKTGKLEFVVVHAKIARGAFARWLITQRNEDPSTFTRFDDLGYHYEQNMSAPDSPVFVCETFGGVGRSIRIQGRE